jgi:hypothetical protein
MNISTSAARAAAIGGAQPSLADHGIHLRGHRPGEHRLPCPEWARTKHRPGDIAPAMRVESGSRACWLCHRCGWKSATSSETALSHRPGQRRPPLPEAPSDPAPDPEGERRRALAQEIWRQIETITDGVPFDYLTRCDHDGERATAARMATDLLRQHRLTWREVLAASDAQPRPCPACAAREAGQQHGWAEGEWARADWRKLAWHCLAHRDLLTAWETGFLNSILRRRHLSERQGVLDRIADKVWEAG